MIITLTSSSQLTDLLKEEKVFIDFYADWCGPCKMQGPILEAFSKKFPDVKIVKVNVDQHTDLAETYGVMSIPTLFVFKQGKETYKKPGFHALNQLEKL
jgi:thioredoxin 1